MHPNPPLVSVVTPFYNTAGHLRECIESVLAQDHANLDYLLQDNASTDGGSEIAREYAARDSRIRYVRNQGLLPQVPNYNLALERIHPDSRYVKMVQADDWLARDCLSRMVEVGEASARVGLISAMRFKGAAVEGEGLHYSQSVLDGRTVCRLHLMQPVFLFGSPTTVMYRSEVVRSRRPFFAEGRLNEDTEACYEILREWDFGFVHQILSYTRVDADSMFGSVRQLDSVALGQWIQFNRYSGDTLSTTESAARRLEIERHYYRRLARARIALREPDYWAFHRRWLAADGLTLDPTLLARATLRELASVLACPQRTLDYLRAWRQRARRVAE